jgi:quercetin dioxygenase-like cupin family protein
MIVRRLDDILNTLREVKGDGWSSRRLVLNDDRVGHSFHDVVIEAGTESRMWYKNHFETVYCIEGEGEVENTDDGRVHPITPGTVYVLDKNDSHLLRARSRMRLMCVFTPALSGHEIHDADGAYQPLEEKTVFVIGLNDFNLQMLNALDIARHIHFVNLLDTDTILEQQEYPIKQIIHDAKQQIRQYRGTIDGIIHYIDFPVSTMVPILCEAFDLPSASLESVLKCEHKYWSRVEQRATIPENVPAFAAFDPFDDDALAKITETVAYPFWIKPVKSFSSYLGFYIAGPEDFNAAIPEIRANIGRFAGPFNYLLDRVTMPEGIRDIRGGHCIAEAIIGGSQCTQEGYSFRGDVEVYGTIDSFREANLTTFSSYQYPSILPDEVQERMTQLSKAVIGHIGYDNAPFNIEYYWNKETDQIWILEINTRISESHCRLFEFVDGSSHHKVAIELATGKKPLFPHREGKYNVSGKFFMRQWEDLYVEDVPGPEVVQHLEQELVPDSIIVIGAEKGKNLSDLMDQDSYSYRTALMFIGGSDKQDLEKKRQLCEQTLNEHFRFSEPRTAT